MERQTRTELDKIVMIGMGRIDQLVNQLCDGCVAPQIEVEKPRYETQDRFRSFFGVVPGRERIFDAGLQQLAAAQSSLLDEKRLAGMANAYGGTLGFLGGAGSASFGQLNNKWESA